MLCCAVLCCRPAYPAQGQGDREKEISDCKLIVQNIVYGTKTLLFSILYCTRHYHSAQQHEAARAAAMAAGQVYLRTHLHQHGLTLLSHAGSLYTGTVSAPLSCGIGQQ